MPDFTIRPFTPDMEDIFFDFFDNRAFTDDTPYAPCYCYIWYMSDRAAWERDWKKAEAQGISFRDFLRSQALGFVRSGTIKGYFAFDGDIPIGWVNAGDRESYVRSWLAGGNALPDEDARVKSVVCFEISPEYRNMGIAAALLERVCADAAEEGYDFAEGYSEKRDQPYRFDYSGPVKLYEKCGFTVYKEFDRHLVMRKSLK